MNRVTKIIASTAVAIGLAGGTLLTTADPAAANTKWGCPDGYVCMYTSGGLQNHSPDLVFYTYGVHQFYGQYGKRFVVNNQTGGAKMSVNAGWDGSGASKKVKPGKVWKGKIDKKNSVTLYTP